MSRIDLDRRQAEELARFVIENHDRIPEGVYLIAEELPRSDGMLGADLLRVEGRGEEGRIVNAAIIRPRRGE